MEWVWLIAAAVLGGVGNGLAGISAATVLVPVLIVLCPTFGGDSGAFQATTLALTCDILSSAVTAAVYVRHGNIDLRRGWLMLACVWAMSVAGSVVAWMVGGAVLGGFCLFLTFAIGIRYLVKPESKGDADAEGAGGRLTPKAIAVSLFFGLTIGFGTGFVGTGGGMMMFIVFTAFLGYSSRKAVGTATFIMTGTALIASVAHYLIDPSLLVEHADMVVVCVGLATVTSLASAQFANRVEGRTVGLVTGVILTLLGGSMIVLNYHDFFTGLLAGGGLFADGGQGAGAAAGAASGAGAGVGAGAEGVPGVGAEGGLFAQTLACLIGYLRFLVPTVVVLALVKVLARGLPREVFRKLLHAVAFSSGVVLAYSTESWQAAACASALFAVVVYPALALAERWSGYAGVFNERRAGEVKVSLLLLFGVSAAVIVACWGVAGQRELVPAVLLTWGFGDAAAGLVGKRFGKHKTGLRIADPNKTWEGSASFAVVAFVACCVTLVVAGGQPLPAALWRSVIAAVVGAIAELVSRNGNDTVIVPVALSATLIALSAVPC